jgi:hypothetical protein
MTPDKEKVLENLREWHDKDVQALMVAIDIVRLERGLPFSEIREMCGEAITRLESILRGRTI